MLKKFCPLVLLLILCACGAGSNDSNVITPTDSISSTAVVRFNPASSTVTVLDHGPGPQSEVFEACTFSMDTVTGDLPFALVDADTLAGVEQGIDGETRSGVRIVRASHGAVDVAVLLGLTAAAEDDLDARPSHHDSEEDHDHDDFDSFVVTGGAVADAAPLLAAIAGAIDAHDILRVKGFVAVEGKPARLLVQAVGPRIQHHFDRAWLPEEARRTQLVVIGQKGLDRAAIERVLGEVIG